MKNILIKTFFKVHNVEANDVEFDDILNLLNIEADFGLPKDDVEYKYKDKEMIASEYTFEEDLQQVLSFFWDDDLELTIKREIARSM